MVSNNRHVPRKSFGQHFLTSPYYIQRIVDSIPAETSENVLEIGAGRGALSMSLIKRYPNLHMIEIDKNVIPILKENLGYGTWTLHEANALNFDYTSTGVPIHLVGNLPYNVGAHIIRKTLSMKVGTVLSCTFMVQREVAERIVAPADTKKNGFLSIFCQFFGTPRILFHVPPGAFYPKPNVESSVFQIMLNDPTHLIAENQWEPFFSFVDKGFSMRRKMLAGVLGYKGKKEAYASLLKRIGLSEKVRPENLNVGNWVKLFRIACDEGL